MKSNLENLPNSPKMVKIMTIFMVLKRNNKYKDTTGFGMKNWSKLATDSTKETADMREGGGKNLEKLPTLFMDGS